ncbi:MAG: hypothetical protein EXS00_07895 [Phycisphaerales bacterium]|nr:hypothetical protein [Phycisphaerales bacterium]
MTEDHFSTGVLHHTARNLGAQFALTAALFITSSSAACPPDLDDDGLVDAADLGQLLSQWGTSGSGDLDGNGVVAAADLAQLLGSWGACAATPLDASLACNQLGSYPHANFVNSFNAGATITAGIDTTRHGLTAQATCNLWVLTDRTASQWQADPSLTDVRGVPQTLTLATGGLPANRFTITGATTLSADAADSLGRGYDLVLDMDQSGALSSGDLIDGLDEVGFWVLKDASANGTHATSISTYTASGATAGYTAAKIYYPTDIASMGSVPVVIISHGNGHQYTWYDYLGNHLSSWGFVVMSHQNNTVPGIETCSLTTLQHTGALFAQQATIAAGALTGHLDATRIIWVGHSRGGDGILRAYDRLFDSSWTPPAGTFTLAGIKLLIPISPTDFNGRGGVGSGSDPHSCPVYLFYGAADGDVCGCPDSNVADSFNLYERALGDKSSCYIHGADHNDFNCCGVNDFAGPAGTALGTAPVQSITKSQMLAAIQWKLGLSDAATDLLWRPYEDFRAVGNLSTAIVVRDFVPTESGGGSVIDDFQTQTAVATSSSGGMVSATVTGLAESVLNDNNLTFTWATTDPHNGATRVGVGDTQRAGLFEWTAASMIEWSVTASQSDFADDVFLQLRAAQGTRHPQTVAQTTTSLTFTITLIDSAGGQSSVAAGAYGGGIQRPYLRTGYGTGSGWQEEFELVRIRLTDFLANGAQVDLAHIAKIRLNFGIGSGTSVGRLEIDDIMTSKE